MPPDDVPPSVEALLAESTWIAGLARSLVVDPGTADDVAQDAAVTAIARAPADLRSPRGWLRRVVTRLASNARRSATRRVAREVASAPADVAESPDEIVARWEIRRRVVEAVLALDEPYRATILARYFDGLSLLEAAARSGVPAETVRTRTRRGLDLLRGRLAHLDDGRGGRGVAAIVWLAAPTGEPALRLLPVAGASSAGGIVMAAGTKWLVAAGVLLAVGVGVFWTAGRDRAPPADVGVVSPPEAPPLAGGHPRAARPDASAEPKYAGAEPAPGAPVNLDACDRERDLHGIVVDADGKPVAGAAVAALRNDAWRLRIPDLRRMFEEEVVKATRSASDGTFALRLGVADGVHLRADAEGFAAWESWDMQAGERVRIVLGPAATLTVKVRREDGTPVPGATVHVLGNPRDDRMFRKHGTTDAAGAVVIRGVPRGARAVLFIEPTGAGPTLQRKHELGDGAEPTFEVVLPAGGDLSGRIVDSATESPVRGASVGSPTFGFAEIPAADDGTFTYRGFGGGDRKLSVRAPGYAPVLLRVPPGETEIRIPMSAGVAASGRVLDAQGAPVAGAVVTLLATPRTDAGSQLSLATAITAGEGKFRVADLLGGVPHVLIVRAAGLGTLRREVPLEGAPGSEVALGDFRLGPARRVRVVALGPGDVPVARREVHLVFGTFSARESGDAEVRRTDDLGRAAFADVPQGTWTVRDGRDGPEVRVEVGDADPPQVVLRVAGPAEATAVVAAAATPAAGGELVVTVVDESGAPIPKTFVQVEFDRGGGHAAPTDANGVARVPCRATPIRVQTMAGAPFLSDPRGIELAADRRDVRIVLRRGAAISGRVLDADGRPFAGASVTASASGRASWGSEPSAEDGSWVVHVADGEPVELEVTAPRTRAARDGPSPSAWLRGVRPGAAGIELRLAVPSETSPLRVRAVDPAGAPLGGVAVLVLPLGTMRFLRATTGDDGTAVVADVPRSLCSVCTLPHESGPAIQGFAQPSAVRVVAGQDEEVVLQALVAVHVRGRVSLPEGASPSLASVTAQSGDGYFGVAKVAEDGTFDLVLAAAAKEAWLVRTSVQLPRKGGGNPATAAGAATVRAPADGVEIHCELIR